MAALPLVTSITMILISLLISPSTSQTLSNISGTILTDPLSLDAASHDFGNITSRVPKGVHCPKSSDELASLVSTVYRQTTGLRLAARGQGHSLRGQAMVEDGLVVNMTCLQGGMSFSDQGYVDVSGETLWVDLLREGLSRGVAPVTWTDYLYLTVGGTLSNAGIGGQTFKHGPQISNVLELDVVTGKGEKVTCSPSKTPHLFYGALGGLGQFGIISRARVVLDRAPERVKWIRALYSDFSAFTRDQERLISASNSDNVVDYVEGQIAMSNGVIDTSFYPSTDESRVVALVEEHSIVYVLEVAKYYDGLSLPLIDQVLALLESSLGLVTGFFFVQDVPYFDFLNRVGKEEEKLRALGLWNVPHPWLNLYVPRSRISDFNDGVLKGILLNQNSSSGTTLFYPTNRNKLDDRMSAVIPEEEVFYVVGLLHTSTYNNWQQLDDVNHRIVAFCNVAGIDIKHYLARFSTQEEWMLHFGSKWHKFQQRKIMFDPRRLLSPGQGIFN